LSPVFDPENRNPDWRTSGIAYDAAYGTEIPGRGWTYVESGGRHRVEMKARNFIGIARGRNNYLAGFTELAYPEARKWLLGMAEQAIAFGVDGIDVRVTTHTESLDWENYGFGKPVVDEFKRRHGVDIANGEKFDRAAWRKLRGEYFTNFLGEIGERLRSRGKKLCVQLRDDQHRSAEEICYMEVFWDWQRWVRERMVDMVHLTKFYTNWDLFPRSAQLCRENDIELMYTAGISGRDEDWQRDGPIILERCKQNHIEILNFYETGGFVRLEENGLAYHMPSLWKDVREHSK
ncbi:MAG TPA: hypothetical protein VEJ63_22445, partial [Planctomycetota bacterium]|nr:hypothetical protein [Planctomycetota bacterium]